MSERNTNLVGITSALGASVLFTINDTTIKFLSGDYALHQIVLIRSLIAFAVITLLLLPLSGGFGQLRTRRFGVHALRGGFVVFANMCFFMGLAAMPIADATAIFFVSPLVITGFSVIFLREQVGPRRWAAVAVGLLGVLIIVRPGADSFQAAALLPLMAAVGYASLHILTRRLGATESPISMAFYIQLIFVLVSAGFGIVFGQGAFADVSSASTDFVTRAWGVLQPEDYRLFIVIGLASAFGGWLISRAYALCEAGLAAPFEYVALPLAIFWGWLVFEEWPDAWAWVGIALIVTSGLYMAWREAGQGLRLTTRRPKRR
ncbi:DMT family transporter [Aliiroseovarius subalbicans]|uniref:DMT family transporter n=1 Tax=Aliiroseovarius subalbicans TaxID=2925840 RepID=UPI001F586435|nr:DMT family transporter [Aliiroseovarius subalbicans]MCI2399455.1 DMT family transporter [Aliiroseovarius subalbicans]